MRTIYDIRRDNLRSLISQWGGRWASRWRCWSSAWSSWRCCTVDPKDPTILSGFSCASVLACATVEPSTTQPEHEMNAYSSNRTAIDSKGRVWTRVDDGSNPHAELWTAEDARLMAHGWAVCIPGDEPDHATWSMTTYESIARGWYENA